MDVKQFLTAVFEEQIVSEAAQRDFLPTMIRLAADAGNKDDANRMIAMLASMYPSQDNIADEKKRRTEYESILKTAIIHDLPHGIFTDPEIPELSPGQIIHEGLICRFLDGSSPDCLVKALDIGLLSMDVEYPNQDDMFAAPLGDGGSCYSDSKISLLSLTCSLGYGAGNIVDVLVERGADLNTECERNSPIGRAAEADDFFLVECLLDHGATRCGCVEKNLKHIPSAIYAFSKNETALAERLYDLDKQASDEYCSKHPSDEITRFTSYMEARMLKSKYINQDEVGERRCLSL